MATPEAESTNAHEFTRTHAHSWIAPWPRSFLRSLEVARDRNWKRGRLDASRVDDRHGVDTCREAKALERDLRGLHRLDLAGRERLAVDLHRRARNEVDTLDLQRLRRGLVLDRIEKRHLGRVDGRPVVDIDERPAE